MDIKNDLGAKIRECRKAAGLSQVQLGEKVGSNQEHISKLEKGRINASVDYLSKVAEALGLEVKIFFEKK